MNGDNSIMSTFLNSAGVAAGALVVAMGAVATPASAHITLNAVTSNAITLNALTSNSLTLNALTSNALTSNAITINALVANALTGNALTQNALSQNAFTPGGSAIEDLNGVAVDVVILPGPALRP